MKKAEKIKLEQKYLAQATPHDSEYKFLVKQITELNSCSRDINALYNRLSTIEKLKVTVNSLKDTIEEINVYVETLQFKAEQIKELMEK